MLLTVEYDGESVVELHLDEEGLDLLVDRLMKLRKHNEPEHDHLMTPSWAGWELTEEKQDAENELINHLTIFCHPKGGKRLSKGQSS